MAGGRLFRAPIRHDFGDPAVVILLAATKKNNDGIASTFIQKTNATAHSLHTCTISVLLYRIHSSFGNQRGRYPFVRIAKHTLVEIRTLEYLCLLLSNPGSCAQLPIPPVRSLPRRTDDWQTFQAVFKLSRQRQPNPH